MDMIFRCLWFGLLAATGTVAHAQTTVYKCSTGAGTVYSGQPCAAAGSNMKVLRLQAPPPADPAELQRRAAARDEMAMQHRQRELSRQEAACIDNRAAATRRGTQRRINGYQRQIDQLYGRMGYVHNLASVQWANGIREQIGSLQAAISNEKRILAQTELNARSICAHQRAMAGAADHP